MRNELKQRWLDALRQGRYTQGFRYLRRGNGYCCLGVLCDIINSNNWNYLFDDLETFEKVYGYAYNEKYLLTSSFSKEFCEEIGLDFQHQCRLVFMNDGQYTFTQIADWIQENIKDASPEDSENC